MVQAPLYSVRGVDAVPASDAGVRVRAGIALSIPNLITLGRILLVPIVVWAIASGAMWIAFILFLAAGLSDAVDGYLAKRFHMTTMLGAYLDPAADKLLLVSVFVVLGWLGELPLWLVIAAVSRDALIVGAVVLGSLMASPLDMKPLMVSKANTAVQIVLAAVVLAELAFALDFGLQGFVELDQQVVDGNG